MGWTLPSTGMWRGEVFAIFDCLVHIVLMPDIEDGEQYSSQKYRVAQKKQYRKYVKYT